ncbi:TPR repeat-containing adenylate/guanylate cyclase [Nitzschia inconspicua]|uniref:TPR repeat-containing adenylate/guanylate cyclase n=1 Tax=Nitzschia inconspicua TaxID=303405 RepID=A0A9K3LMA2_9STRA|nr:TPR repeat-containing adenylate/guanylate cyclase [Nitzschia inconspicua]
MDEPTANSSSTTTAATSVGPHPPTATTRNRRVYDPHTRPVPRAYFPSSESLASSALCSSTDGSTEVYSGESELESSSEYSSESSEGSFDEEGLQEMLIPPHGRRPLILPPRPAGASSVTKTAATAKPPLHPPPIPFPPSEGLPFGGPEGLPFTLESLKRDLEKVGRAIITSNAGEIAAERAQTLASINWLASHVPNAVLDKLGHEIRDTLDQDDNGNESDSHSDGSTLGVDRVTDIISDDAMSEVSELSNHDDDRSFEEEETMRMVEPADVSNVGISYGDLAKFAHTAASAFLPEDEMIHNAGRRDSGLGSSFLPEIDETNPSRTPLDRVSMSTIGSILSELPMKRDERDLEDASRKPTSTSSILDMIPTKRGQEDLTAFAARKTSISTVTTASSTTSARQSGKKGVKGLLRRFKKGKSATSQTLLPPPPMSPLDVPRNKITPDSSRLYPPKTAKNDIVQKELPSSSTQRDEEIDGEQFLEKKRLPFSTKYRCALLFVDISGFTKLSRLLDPESLSKAINTYFQLIVDEVLDGKGDLLKFAGDAVFIEWKATADCSLETCVESAVNCAVKILSRCADFSVLSNGATGNSSYLLTSQAAQVDTLNVHCGVGAGQMVGVHVGDHKSRREYLLLGQPITQATAATDYASLGEVAISPEAHSILSRVCDFKGSAAVSDGETPTIVANRDELRFTSKKRFGTHVHRKIVNDISRGVTRHVEGLEVDALRKYRRMMSLYVHPVVVDNDLAAAHHIKSKKVKKIDRSEQERHREEAEIRNVFTMFVNPKVETQVTKDESSNSRMYETLNDIMNLSTREIERFHGHLRQFIVDDKGLVMIITFGLRGTTIPNMVSHRALPASIAIHNSLKLELGIDSRIGATIGEAYCGVVGGVKRHEYAVLGPSVNLAARLMASKINPGILVDNRVRMMANRSFGFNALAPVVAKGYSEPVPIFEPLSTLERYWGRIISNFVGRKQEIKTLMQNASEMLKKRSQNRFILVESKSGVGKSTLIAHGIEHIRRTFNPKNNRLIVVKNVSKESDSLVPFGVFRNILGKILSSFQKGVGSDERSLKSGASLSTHGLRSIAWESLSGRSIAQSTQQLSAEHSVEIFQLLCQELKMSPTFVDYALSELLGVELTQIGHSGQNGPPSTKEMVTFLAKAFRLCTRDSKLVILALDDMHYVDEFSWRVIQQLFIEEQNILFVGAVETACLDDLKIDPDFWGDLDSQYRGEKRFLTMKLGHLGREDILSMIMKSLGLRRKDVPDDVLDGVAIQSGGMPHFVNEILENVKKEMAVDDDFELADMTFDSFGDLVLQRLDSFDINTRNVLNIGAVIGLSFSLDDLVAVELRTSDGCEEAVRKLTEEALQTAIEDGILESREMCDEDSDEEESCRYAFCHAVWRGTLLNLMLEGRKRDLHRVIAETLEETESETNDYMFQAKLFKHWVNSGNLLKSTELALSVGHHFEERLGLPAQSIRIYTEALDLLRESEDGYSKGFSKDILAKVSTEDLTCIIQLQVSLAKALAMAQQTKESVSAFQDALKITQIAHCSSQLKDRSILFPVFDGLASAVKNGHIKQDSECRYEKAMLRRYMQETRLHGDPIYIIHALTLQADMHGRLGEYEKAIEIQTALSQIYNGEFFSVDLCDIYGLDIGAQCLASGALWRMQLDMTEEALSICRFVTSTVLPQIERRNVHASFMVLYPVLLVLMDCGMAPQAREHFEKFVCEPFTELPQGMSTFFFPMYDPILMLLDLKGGEKLDQGILDDYLEWASDLDNLFAGEHINSRTCEMGRTADSMSAEICYLLAKATHEPTQHKCMVDHGRKVAERDVDFVKDRGNKVAKLYSHRIHTNLDAMNENLEL